MTTITTTIQANNSFKGNGWEAFRYTRMTDALSLEFAWKRVKECKDLTWPELKQTLSTLKKEIKDSGIKSTVSVYMEARDISICRPNKIMSSIWILPDGWEMEEHGMKKEGEASHVVMDGDHYLCKHCGARQKFTLPADIPSFVAEGTAFTKQHTHCKAPEQSSLINQ
jgi:hypothetical protein